MPDEVNPFTDAVASAFGTGNGFAYDAVADLIIGGRSEQQDAVGLHPLTLGEGTDALLMIVSDGMGGHAGGAVASRTAVDSFVTRFLAESGVPVSQRLRMALDSANQAIGQGIAERPELKGMGCTLVAAVQTGRQVRWVSVGDTLLLEISKSRLRRLNQDHSMAPVFDEQAASGEITWEEARTNPMRNMLRSALTGGVIALVDEGAAHLSAGALLVIATDGILSLSEHLLAEIADRAIDPAAFVDQVLRSVCQDMAPDQDNTSLVVSRVPGTVTRPVALFVPLDRRKRNWPLIILAVALATLVGTAILLIC